MAKTSATRYVRDIKDLPPPQARRHESVLDTYEPYLQLRREIREGAFKPCEEAGIVIGPAAIRELRMKAPWRIIKLHLLAYIRSLNVISDYFVREYRSSPDEHVVTVAFVPPEIDVGTVQPHLRKRVERMRRAK